AINFHVGKLKGSYIHNYVNVGLTVRISLDTTVQNSITEESRLQPPLAAKDEAFYNYCGENTFVLVQANISSIDLINKVFNARVSFQPCGEFLIRAGGAIPTQLGGNFPITGQMNLTIGDINQYPFDRFESDPALVFGTFTNATGSIFQVPIVMVVQGSLISYNLEFPLITDFSNNDDGTIVAFTVRVTRAFTTKFFSMMVLIVMWVLSLLSMYMSATIWIRERKVEPPTLGLAISLVFALPALRNSQPGIPPIGCVADVIALFWTVALATISVSMLYMNYIVKYGKEGGGSKAEIKLPFHDPVPTEQMLDKDKEDWKRSHESIHDTDSISTRR
ncbi:hypothetical protein HK101_008966, partial [Irineochytrium annulatum]